MKMLHLLWFGAFDHFLSPEFFSELAKIKDFFELFMESGREFLLAISLTKILNVLYIKIIKILYEKKKVKLKRVNVCVS
jgi:hypothetical protein